MPQELFRAMVEHHGEAVYRLAYRYTGDRFTAEEIAQETFLRAYAGIRGFDRGRPAGPWLLRIALNLCRNRWRSAREIPMEEQIAALEADPNPGPEQIYLQREAERELASALQALPPIYREVLILKHVNELSYTEIATVLGLNLSLVKNRLYRGRIMLREALQRGGSVQ